MTPNNSQNSKLPMPVPPPAAAPESTVQRLLRHKFLLVSLVVLLFVGSLFLWGARRGVAPQGHKAPGGAAAPHDAAPEKAPKAEPEAAAPAPHEAAAPHAGAAPVIPPPVTAAPATPPVSPLVAPPKERVKGEAFTRALIKIMDDQVNQTWFGWRPNSILFGKLGLTDNVNNVQLGVLEVARRTIVVMNENMTRFATTEAYNPQINEAMNFIMVSADKYWFPSASGKYREAMRDLEIYIESLHKGRSRFYSRVDNLIALLANYKDIMGSSFHNLIKDSEADGKEVTWWVSDDYFYFSKGMALGMADMLEAVSKDFDAELQKKNSHKLLEDAIHALHQAGHLSPWIVFNGSKDGLIANHRANMGTYIGEAEHVISTLVTVLATN
jgi:hypothetical protein